eukprot:365807-Chlamydomonas_euryale.AAC.6
MQQCLIQAEVWVVRWKYIFYALAQKKAELGTGIDWGVAALPNEASHAHSQVQLALLDDCARYARSIWSRICA